MRTRSTLPRGSFDIAHECTVLAVTAGIAHFLQLFDLEPIEVNIFRGTSLLEERERVYGGQVAAQSLIAAGRTVEWGGLHSFHAYFLRPGDPSAPILYEVDRVRDGRSFTTRRVVAIQHGRAIFFLSCSFHKSEEGLDHEIEMPPVPGPNEIEPLGSVPPDRPMGAPLSYLVRHGLDVRFVGGPPWARDDAARPAEQLWFRWPERLSNDPVLHLALATFVSDLTLIQTILSRHGRSSWNEQFFGASLDHSMWYHEPFRVDDWLLYHQQSPVARGALGLAIGSIFNEKGRLVATAAQEGLVRMGARR